MLYKNYKTIQIGGSDIAALVVVGCTEAGNAEAQMLRFGRDGCYKAYLCDENAEIGEHYSLEATVYHWLTIYDDQGLTVKLTEPSSQPMVYKIYRAAEMGCIIQALPA